MTTRVLILYYSRHGATQRMAELIGQGASQNNVSVSIRTVPSLHSASATPPETPTHPYIEKSDLIQSDAFILGSPTRFGNMSANLKFFLENTLDIWLSGQLIGKPAGVFTSSSTLHGGQESTLLSMMLPLLHHGMLIQGIPYSQLALHRTQRGGTPYGPTHVSGTNTKHPISTEERTLCLHFGKQIATLAAQLSQS